MQTNGEAKDSGATNWTSVAFTLTPTQAEEGLIFGAWINPGVVSTIVDDASGGSQVWTPREVSGPIQIYDCLHSKPGVTTVTITFSATCVGAAFLLGFDDLEAFDKSTYLENGNTTAWTSGFTTDSLIAERRAFGIAGTFSGSGQNFTPGNGWNAVTGTGITNGHRGASSGEDVFMEQCEIAHKGPIAAIGGCTNSYVYAAVAAYKLKQKARFLGRANTDLLIHEGIRNSAMTDVRSWW